MSVSGAVQASTFSNAMRAKWPVVTASLEAMKTTTETRLGATPLGDGNTFFRVWAPDRKKVEVAVETQGSLRYLPLEAAAGGYFSGTHPVGPGARYRYRLDGGE